MTVFTQTITNRIGLFGPAPTDNWGDYNWGDFLWAEGTKDFVSTTIKVVANSVSPDSTVAKTPFPVITNTITPVADMGSEQLLDGEGYLYVFPSDVTEAEDRSITTWTPVAANSPTWTPRAATSTTWSAA